MSIINNNLLLAAEEGGYRIERSLRFRSSASAFLNRTPSTASNRTTWTWSGWVKRGSLGVARGVFDAYSNDQNFTQVVFDSLDRLYLYTIAAGVDYSFETTAVFRDPSAWYHIVVVLNTPSGTQADRFIIYVNGVRQAGGNFYGAFAQNVETYINSTSEHKVGRVTDSAVSLDGYMTEINFVDGHALTPSDFGEFNEDTGVWQPKRYAGTYGTNGFYLNFKNNASTSALGTDYSGNGNNWTTNNISLTAGATYDSMIDVPTPYDDGGNGRGNYCTLNPLDSAAPSNISNGNLQISAVSDACGTLAVSSGKWYFEVTRTDGASNIAQFHYGLLDSVHTAANRSTSSFTKGILYRGDGVILRAGSTLASGLASVGQNSILGVAFDMDAKTVQFYVNNVAQSTAQTILDADVMPWTLTSATSSSAANFGQRPFAYTPPTGFKALNTQNLPEPTIVQGNQHFDVLLWTGNGSGARTFSGLNLSPDFVWTKARNQAYGNLLFDSVRGGNRNLMSQSTNAELVDPITGYISTFNSDGFSTVAGTANNGDFNELNTTQVAWNWRGSDSAAVSNTAGSITSTVSANPTAGFSVVTYMGNGSAGATVGHGLGVAPRMLVLKSRSASADWQVYHASVGATAAINLNGTGGSFASAVFFNNTAPTSNVFTLGNLAGINGSGGTFVAYCFSEVAGYSRFGSYTGNGSADGPFIFLGFRPRFVLYKRTDAVEGWYMYDTARTTINVMGAELRADSSAAESDFSSRDFLSNGFKIRTANGSVNASGGTYIFMAFAENPFKNALAR